MQAWSELSEIARKQTGRRVVGTGGGLYAFSETELCVPEGSVEGLVHDLCHWVVASDEERKQPNMGLSQDWTHPGFDRMVRCEELAWSLEFYLFGDPPIDVMASLLTPEARASGGGVNITSHGVYHSGSVTKDYGIWRSSCLHHHECEGWLEAPSMTHQEAEKRLTEIRSRSGLTFEIRRGQGLLTLAETADVVAYGVTQAAIAEMERARSLVIGHGELRPEGNEELRREACRKAEQAGLPVAQIQKIVRAWWLSQYQDQGDDELATCWDSLKR